MYLILRCFSIYLILCWFCVSDFLLFLFLYLIIWRLSMYLILFLPCICLLYFLSVCQIFSLLSMYQILCFLSLYPSLVCLSIVWLYPSSKCVRLSSVSVRASDNLHFLRVWLSAVWSCVCFSLCDFFVVSWLADPLQTVGKFHCSGYFRQDLRKIPLQRKFPTTWM